MPAKPTSNLLALISITLMLNGCAGLPKKGGEKSSSDVSEGMAMIQQLRQHQQSQLRVLTWHYATNQQQPNPFQRTQLMALALSGGGRMHVSIGPVNAESDFQSALMARNRSQAIVELMAAHTVGAYQTYNPALSMNTIRVEWTAVGDA